MRRLRYFGCCLWWRGLWVCQYILCGKPKIRFGCSTATQVCYSRWWSFHCVVSCKCQVSLIHSCNLIALSVLPSIEYFWFCSHAIRNLFSAMIGLQEVMTMLVALCRVTLWLLKLWMEALPCVVGLKRLASGPGVWKRRLPVYTLPRFERQRDEKVKNDECLMMSS